MIPKPKKHANLDMYLYIGGVGLCDAGKHLMGLRKHKEAIMLFQALHTHQIPELFFESQNKHSVLFIFGTNLTRLLQYKLY